MDKIINLQEYKLYKITQQRLGKCDFTEKMRLELKQKIKNEKINGASFMIFDDFLCPKQDEESKKRGNIY
jgi:hypothetical protein